MYPALSTFIQQLPVGAEKIPTERLALLKSISDYCLQKVKSGEVCHLNFICTHNSRRSHMGQIWARAMAVHHGIAGVESWSGGTEATAFNPNAIEAMKQAGFDISMIEEGSNPHYRVRFSEEDEGTEAWSKVFSDPINPSQSFGAIMTCQEAAEACPYVPGAEMRVGLSYDDPKAFDGTPQQAEKYAERSLQIATEMWKVFADVKAQL